MPAFRSIVFALLALGSLATAQVQNRSRSGQFSVYSEDKELRMRIVSYAQELKGDLMQFLRGDGDADKVPIIVTMVPANGTVPATPVTVQWMNTPAGAKIDVIVRLGGDPANVFLQRHLVRAMLLEMSFRERPAPKANEPYLMPPWWLVEGIVESLRRREVTESRDIFKSIVDSQKVPVLEKWLAQPPVNLETAAGAVDRACAMCLVEALLDQPGGPRGLEHFLSAWPGSGGNALATLTDAFPSLASSPQSLAKWWTLQLARYATGDKLQGLSLAESDAELAKLLKFEIVVDKTGKTEKFELKDFPRFVKIPTAKNALQGMQVKLVTLGTTANPILRGVIQEYVQICVQLTAKKTHKIAERIAANEKFREFVLERSAQITDYMNWYEATQPAGRTNSFAGFLKEAAKLEEPPEIPVDPRIAEYLNGLEKEFAPVVPGAGPELHVVPDTKTDTAVNRPASSGSIGGEAVTTRIPTH